MGASPRLDVGLKLGFTALAMGVMMAACGSITVIDPDASADAITDQVPDGMGGSNSGHGGMHGGGTGGVTGGGTGGTLGGTGGSKGGGSGGTSGGVGGRPGGPGGTSGGMGGTVGGAGGTGGSGPTCADIQKSFLIALADARACVVGASGYCQVRTLDRLDCGCPTYVTQTNKLDQVRAQWSQSGCSSGICPNNLCVVYTGATCGVPSAGGSPVCQDSSGLPTP
jgi:hypothetical protein